MSFSDRTGRSWVHHLQVETNHPGITVAWYFLEFLTLDLIDAEGKVPLITVVEEVDEINPLQRHVYWNWPFSLAEVTEMCQLTLPEQADPLDVDPQLVQRVWYDGEEILWVPAETEG